MTRPTCSTRAWRLQTRSAAVSISIHILLLGWIAGVPVANKLDSMVDILKVSLIEPPTPLPIGELAGPESPEPGPAPPPAEVATPEPIPPPPVAEPEPVPEPARPVEAVEEPPAPVAPLVERPSITAPSAGGAKHGGGDGAAAPSSVAGAGGVPGGTQASGSGVGGGGSGARPDYHVNPKPPYPRMARRLGIQGVVVLRIYVLKDGSVGRVKVQRSSGFGSLDKSALRTVRSSWRFLPARHDGVTVDSWVEVPIKFTLDAS